MKNISTQAAVIVCVALVVLGALVYTGADIGDLVLFLMGVLGVGGYAELRGIRSQTNGNVTRLMDELAEHRKALVQVTRRQPPDG